MCLYNVDDPQARAEGSLNARTYICQTMHSRHGETSYMCELVMPVSSGDILVRHEFVFMNMYVFIGDQI